MTNTTAPVRICLLDSTHYLREAIRINIRHMKSQRHNPALHAALLGSLGQSRRLLPLVKAANS